MWTTIFPNDFKACARGPATWAGATAAIVVRQNESKKILFRFIRLTPSLPRSLSDKQRVQPNVPKRLSNSIASLPLESLGLGLFVQPGAGYGADRIFNQAPDKPDPKELHRNQSQRAVDHAGIKDGEKPC